MGESKAVAAWGVLAVTMAAETEEVATEGGDLGVADTTVAPVAMVELEAAEAWKAAHLAAVVEEECGVSLAG